MTTRATLNRAVHAATLALEAAFAESVAANAVKPLGAPIGPYIERQTAAARALRDARWNHAEAQRRAGCA